MYSLKDLPKFRILRSIEKKIQETVLTILGLDNINKLRDKFEGTAFYNRFRDQVYSVIAVENFFNEKFLNWENIENLQTITFQNKSFRLINARVNEPFFVPNEIKEDFIVFLYTSESDYVYIAGYLPTQPKENYISLINKNISPMKLRSFLGTIEPLSFSKIEELRTI